MQREIFSTADLWKIGTTCTCGEPLKLDRAAHYEGFTSQAILHCDGCGRLVHVTQKVDVLNPGNSIAGTAS